MSRSDKGIPKIESCRRCANPLTEQNCRNRAKNGAICNPCRVVVEVARYHRRVAEDPDHNKKRWMRRKHVQGPKRRAENATPDGRKKTRERNLAAKFGITPEEFRGMSARQGDVCAICGDSPRNQALSIDHIHGSKVIRGLLCDRCNAGIGMFLDDPHRLYKAIVYLTKAKELQVVA